MLKKLVLTLNIFHRLLRIRKQVEYSSLQPKCAGFLIKAVEVIGLWLRVNVQNVVLI